MEYGEQYTDTLMRRIDEAGDGRGLETALPAE
jgi:hypothetical protein